MRAGDVQDRPGRWDIEEWERRALVFGTEESAVFSGRPGIDDHLVVVERFLPTDDSAFVFGLFAPLPPAAGGAADDDVESPLDGAVFDTHIVADDIATVRVALERAALPIGIFADDGRPLVVNAAYRRGGAPAAAGREAAAVPETDASVDRVEAVELSIEEALDLLDVAVSIFDDQDRLIYRNARHMAFYGEICGDMPPGTPMLPLIERVYDYAIHHHGEAMREKLGPRDEWIRRRLETTRLPFFETVDETIAGRWLRCINRRLDSGLLLTLRIDVTEAKHQELTLARQVDETMLYRSVLEEMPIATFVRDSQHRLTFVNQAYADLVGMSRDGMLNTTETELYGDDGEGYYRQNLSVLERGVVIASMRISPGPISRSCLSSPASGGSRRGPTAISSVR